MRRFLLSAVLLCSAALVLMGVAPIPGTPLAASSGNVANATAAATLPAASNQVTYITGFEVTGAGITALGSVTTCTVTGIVGGTLSYTYTAVIGALLANPPLIIQYTTPIPASGPGVAIVVSCPALGAGNTNNTVNAHGFQL
jgi:hypothetical protein